MTDPGAIIKLLDKIDYVADSQEVTRLVGELRFHLQRMGSSAKALQAEIDQVREDVRELNALCSMQSEELKELRLVRSAQRAWSG